MPGIDKSIIRKWFRRDFDTLIVERYQIGVDECGEVMARVTIRTRRIPSAKSRERATMVNVARAMKAA